jgi:phage terminase Nu1 subunit (DNA packaging protein)
MATAAEAAAHVFLGLRRFMELVEDDAITRQPLAAYSLDAVREQYILHIRKIASGRGGGKDSDLASERARLAREQTETAARRNAIARGELVSVEEVGREIEHEYGVVRQRLLAIPGMIADGLVGLERYDLEKKLAEAIADALSELSHVDLAKTIEATKAAE